MKTGRIKEVELSPDFATTLRGGVVLVNDNAESRRLMERCIPKGKVTLNPIIDWEDDDVWELLNDWVKIPHCELYDQGFKRIGCVGCPMGNAKNMRRDFARWPKYKELYIRAFEKMLVEKPKETEWKCGEDVFNWWINLFDRKAEQAKGWGVGNDTD